MRFNLDINFSLQMDLNSAMAMRKDICLYNSDKDTFDNGMAIIDYHNDIRASYAVNVVSSRNTRQMSLTGTEGAAQTAVGLDFPGTSLSRQIFPPLQLSHILYDICNIFYMTNSHIYY